MSKLTFRNAPLKMLSSTIGRPSVWPAPHASHWNRFVAEPHLVLQPSEQLFGVCGLLLHVWKPFESTKNYESNFVWRHCLTQCVNDSIYVHSTYTYIHIYIYTYRDIYIDKYTKFEEKNMKNSAWVFWSRPFQAFFALARTGPAEALAKVRHLLARSQPQPAVLRESPVYNWVWGKDSLPCQMVYVYYNYCPSWVRHTHVFHHHWWS